MTKQQNWNKLQELYYICLLNGIGFELCYEESVDLFYIVITSASEKEKYITKSMSLDTAIEDSLMFLKTLNK